MTLMTFFHDPVHSSLFFPNSFVSLVSWLCNTTINQKKTDTMVHGNLRFLSLLCGVFFCSENLDGRTLEVKNGKTYNDDDNGDDNDELEMMLLLAAVFTQQNHPSIQSRNRKIFHRLLTMEMRRLRDQRIPRVSLHDPSTSSWRQLYLSHNNQALVTLTGFDHDTFSLLLSLFEPVYYHYSPGDSNDDGFIVRIRYPNHGRPRLMTAADCLGLNLAWTRLRVSSMALQLVFGMTRSTVSKWLCFDRSFLIMILSNHTDAAVCIPSAVTIKGYKAAVPLQHSSLADV